MNETVDIFPGGESSHSFNVSDAVSCNDDHNIMRDIKEQNQNTIVSDLQLNKESRRTMFLVEYFIYPFCQNKS